MAPPLHGTTVERLRERLVAAIELGEYAPGQRLIEGELTLEFGVSRGPLREALRLLAVEGLVQIIPNRGAVVRRLSAQEIAHTMQVREALEGLAAAEAARHIGSGVHRRRMEAFLTRFAPGELKPLPKFLEENHVLHSLIVELAGNPQLATLVEQMRVRIFPKRMLVSTTADDAHRLASSREHLALAEAVLSGDAAKSRRLMESHLRKARTRMLAQFAQEPGLG